MTCDDALALIGRAIEGGVSSSELESLVAHLETCCSCGHEAVTQMRVKQVLGSRPFEPEPPSLARGIAARIDAERMDGVRPSCDRQPIDWRSWTLWLLPAAVGLALAAGTRPGLNRAAGDREDLPTAIASWARAELGSIQPWPSDRYFLGAVLLDAALFDGASVNKDGGR